MSIAQKAARGALWTIISSMGGRAIGVLGTLAMTRFLLPDEIGEVSDAMVIALTANWATIWGFGQYTVVKGRGPHADEIAWHATVAYMVLGVVSLGLVSLFAGYLAPIFDAPRAAAYIPVLALALYIRRIGAIPERILQRELKFRAPGMALFLGELVYTVAALTMAAAGYGGWAIVLANIVQQIVVVLVLLRAADRARWATPHRLSWGRYRDMLKFGLPLGVQGTAHGASRYWDNLAISYYFGPGATGAYNMAYNLADIPAIQVGEQIAMVLMPSMAELPPERRPRAFERSAALLSLIIFPLAVGLGLVAYPLIELLLPANKWQLVAPLLTVLACLSVFRPLTWVLSAYFEAESKTSRLMVLEVVKVGVLIGSIALLAPFGVRAASGAVGIAFGSTAIAGVVLAVRAGASARRLIIGFVQPLIACGAMTLAVWGVHAGLVAIELDHPAILLIAMIAAGALAYVATALVVARESSRDLLQLLRKALRRGD